MLVKAVRKGFFVRERRPGETFEMPVKKCPSWCVEVEGKKNVQTPTVATGFGKATEAVAYMKTLETAQAVAEFIEGEKRKTVTDAAAEMLEAFAKAEVKTEGGANE